MEPRDWFALVTIVLAMGTVLFHVGAFRQRVGSIEEAIRELKKSRDRAGERLERLERGHDRIIAALNVQGAIRRATKPLPLYHPSGDEEPTGERDRSEDP